MHRKSQKPKNCTLCSSPSSTCQPLPYSGKDANFTNFSVSNSCGSGEPIILCLQSMDKRGASSLGIHRTKLKKRSRKKKLFHKIVDYLKSDSFMFAPLVSCQPSGPPAKTLPSATAENTTSGMGSLCSAPHSTIYLMNGAVHGRDGYKMDGQLRRTKCRPPPPGPSLTLPVKSGDQSRCIQNVVTRDAHKSISVTEHGVDIMRPQEDENKKLVEKVGDYLKSDSYLYAPLIGPQPSHGADANITGRHSGPVRLLKRVTAEVSTRLITKKTNQPTEGILNIIGTDEPSENTRPKTRLAVRRGVAHRETVKYVVHQHCRSSIPGSGILGTEPRKLVVE